MLTGGREHWPSTREYQEVMKRDLDRWLKEAAEN
jgi:hypothetical protein